MRRNRSAIFVALRGGLMSLAMLSAIAGTGEAQSTGAFTRVGLGARAISMGNALVAHGLGETSPFYNPALAPLVSRQRVDASFGLLTHDRSLQHLQLAVPLRPQAGVAAGVLHAGVSDIDGRDASGYHTETYSTNEFVFFFAFGLRFGRRVTAGVGLRLYRHDLLPDVDPVNSLGLGFGVLVRPIDPLFVGLAVDDLLAKYDWDTSSAFGEDGRQTTDRFPRRIRGGAAVEVLDGRGSVSVEVETSIDPRDALNRDLVVVDGVPTVANSYDEESVRRTRARLGAEWWLVDPFVMRLGVDRIGSETARQVTPSGGFGLVYDIGELRTHVDYAFTLEPYALGTMHVVNLRLNL